MVRAMPSQPASQPQTPPPPSSMKMKPSTSASTSTQPLPNNSSQPFDILTTYRQTRLTSPDLPPALLAIQCLTTALTITPVSTLSETLTLLSNLSATLKTALPRRAVPISAGTDLFQRYLVTTHARPRPAAPCNPDTNGGANNNDNTDDDDEEEDTDDDDFETTKAAIIQAGNTFITRGITARARIAHLARRFVRDGDTILVPAPSRAVAAMLCEAAEHGTFFRVVLVRSSGAVGGGVATSSPWAEDVTRHLAATLKAAEVPVKSIPACGVAHALQSLSSVSARPCERAFARPPYVLAGAAALLSNGSVLGPLGTLGVAVIAKAMGLRVVVAAESFKCVRWEPGMGGEGTGLAVQGLEFVVGDVGEGGMVGTAEAGEEEEEVDMDVTPAALVDTILTEHGPTTSAAVAEDIIKIWF